MDRDKVLVGTSELGPAERAAAHAAEGRGIFLGSVSQKVARLAPCPVMVVP
jgi:nucleotide-binding universal stress UspA family protein